jgi:hypothetical protein
VALGPPDPERGRRLRISSLADSQVTEAKAGTLAPKNVAGWQRFGEWVVENYSRPPDRIRFFGAGNEFNWPRPRYLRTWRDSLGRIHLPAARIIRK